VNTHTGVWRPPPLVGKSRDRLADLDERVMVLLVDANETTGRDLSPHQPG